MKRIASLLVVTCTLIGCATPVTTLQHKKTEQVVTCGGGMAGSIAGGMVGYSIQQNNDADCIKNYEKAGFTILRTTTSSME